MVSSSGPRYSPADAYLLRLEAARARAEELADELISVQLRQVALGTNDRLGDFWRDEATGELAAIVLDPASEHEPEEERDGSKQSAMADGQFLLGVAIGRRLAEARP